MSKRFHEGILDVQASSARDSISRETAAIPAVPPRPKWPWVVLFLFLAFLITTISVIWYQNRPESPPRFQYSDCQSIDVPRDAAVLRYVSKMTARRSADILQSAKSSRTDIDDSETILQSACLGPETTSLFLSQLESRSLMNRSDLAKLKNDLAPILAGWGQAND